MPPTSTTTATPFIPSTSKPRRKQQPHNIKNNIPDGIKPKDFFLANPFQLENEIMNLPAESK